MKRFIQVLFLLLSLGLCAQAHAAKFMFGDQDSINFVANTTIQSPEGSRLFLGHLVTMRSFGLPYYVQSKGLVLGVSGDSKKYLPLPTGDKLADLQKAGHLPSELPKAELTAFDYVIGFALELLLIAVFGYPLLKKALFK